MLIRSHELFWKGTAWYLQTANSRFGEATFREEIKNEHAQQIQCHQQTQPAQGHEVTYNVL